MFAELALFPVLLLVVPGVALILYGVFRRDPPPGPSLPVARIEDGTPLRESPTGRPKRRSTGGLILIGSILMVVGGAIAVGLSTASFPDFW